jgi:hypothetical protein
MAFRNSASGGIFGSIGLNIGTAYNYTLTAKEGPDWDRSIQYLGFQHMYPPAPYDQPSECRIYWLGDNTNGYSNIETMATTLGNLPSVTVGDEETLSLAITCTVGIDPDTLNLGSKGRCITAYIELPEGYDVADINVSTIMLNNTIPAEPRPTAIGDYDNDSVPDLMVKFNRTAVSELILSEGIKYGNVMLTVTGKLYDGTPFEGSDVIRIRMPGDVNSDGKVDIFDVVLVAVRYGESKA